MEVKTRPQTQTSTSAEDKRQFARFAFYRVDPSIRKLDSNVKLQAKEEVLSTIDLFKEKMILFVYSLIATRSDADFMIWQIAQDVEQFEELSSKLTHTSMAPYLNMTHSFFGMTKNKIYDEKQGPGPGDPSKLYPGQHRFLFVQPFVHTSSWYEVARSERQKMSDEVGSIAKKHPSISHSILYSYGMDDQEYIATYETDEPQDLEAMAEELREAKFGKYIWRDTPAFTCVNKDPKLILDSLA